MTKATHMTPKVRKYPNVTTVIKRKMIPIEEVKYVTDLQPKTTYVKREAPPKRFKPMKYYQPEFQGGVAKVP